MHPLSIYVATTIDADRHREAEARRLGRRTGTRRPRRVDRSPVRLWSVRRSRLA
jgi:hypothetical protein